jgi:hypothetical protein
MTGFYMRPTLMRDDPEYQRREEDGLAVLSMHENDRSTFDDLRAEIEGWFAEQFPDSTLFWAGGGNIHGNGRMWHRWLPENAVQATVLRLFWG